MGSGEHITNDFNLLNNSYSQQNKIKMCQWDKV